MLHRPHHPSRQPAVYFFLLLTLVFFVSCFHKFYKINQQDLDTFRENVHTGKINVTEYYVLRQGDTAMHMTDMYFEGDQLHGMLSELPPHRNRDPRTYEGPVWYRNKEKYILQETHLSLVDHAVPPLECGPVTIPVSAIAQVDRYDQATGLTILSHVISVAGIVAPIAVLAMDNSGPSSITAKEDPTSCPYIAAYDGQVFRLQGESFAGAIFPALERHDYLPLPDIRPIDNSYQVRISNEQKEHHYINLAELVVVEHPENTSVLLDHTGMPHLLADPQQPEQALAPNGRDLQLLLRKKDRHAYLYDEGEALFNFTDLTFSKPSGAANARLVLRARSSRWAVMMLDAYTKRFGTDYPAWVERMRSLPAAALYDMMDKQGMRLNISLFADGEWQSIDRIDNIGPLAFRDVVVPIDLRTHAEGTVRIKVEGGHLLWELDYAAMDFTDGEVSSIHHLPPGIAIASDGREYTTTLAADNEQYLHLEPGGNQVTLCYPAARDRNGSRQSVFLHSKGHYEHIKEYRQPPQLEGLPDLQDPGAFIEFSRQQYRQLMETAAR